jgi:predicted RNA-binding protein (virulence factor B family)
VGDTISVFVYHDSDNRLIATTQEPYAEVGDIAALKVVAVTSQGAFLDWGLMKDLFVPVSQQLSTMRLGGKYLVKVYLDAQTGRVAATEKIDKQISNEYLTVKEGEKVKVQVYRESALGYVVIVNQVHQGLVYKNEVFTHIHIGQFIEDAYVKKIREGNKLDIGIGKQGVEKLGDDQSKIIKLLKSHGNFLPYHDKSSPDDIYAFFGMSKKAFKMSVGILYKSKLITIEEEGIRLLPEQASEAAQPNSTEISKLKNTNTPVRPKAFPKQFKVDDGVDD